jgi:anti-sigma regulatory factor (Ser/Thr protein kinase)
MNTLSTNLPRSPDSVSAARQLVNGQTSSLGFQQRQDAALMVSELVTNAVRHGVGAISLRIDVEADAVRVEVADEGNVALAPSPESGAHGG